jgi:starch phosphorylase
MTQQDDTNEAKVAYLSMEIALDKDIPTFSGGLGVLAGDMIRSAADYSLPLVGVTLIYSGGYFYQTVSADGTQVEKSFRWDFLSNFEEINERVKIEVQDTEIVVRGWVYRMRGKTGGEIPVFCLDTNVPENEPWQRQLTSSLYDANRFTRIVQEMILGIGGIRFLNQLGFDQVSTYHMNEGHSAFLIFELLRNMSIDEVRKHCVFTTHTPVEAGLERFDYDLVEDVFRDRLPSEVRDLAGQTDLNMTRLALNASKYVNAVSRKHGEVSRKMFPGYEIDSITNGVHINYWMSPHIRRVLDQDFGSSWHFDYTVLNRCLELNAQNVLYAHEQAKDELLDYEKSHSWVFLDKANLTIGFSRRITEYKRPLLIFSDLERLEKLSKGKVQYVYAGKSHPADDRAKEMIRQLYNYSDELWNSYEIRLVFLENYDIELARMMVSGVDVWLNNPRRYNEASGTSGMKAALNGVLNFSVLDGWWIEGYEREPLAGWAIGPGPKDPNAETMDDDSDAASLYDVLEDQILPAWRDNKGDWLERMKHAIGLGAYFNSDRMVEEYAENAYHLRRRVPWVLYEDTL